MRPRRLAQRWSELRLQFATSGNLHRQTQTEGRDMAQSAPLLGITPIQVSNSQRLKSRGWVKKDTTSISNHWGVDNEKGLMDCYVNGSTLDYSSRELMGYNSNDSDISDQEKGNALSHWANPVQLDLRPEPYDRDPDMLSREAAEAPQVYPEVLPGPLKWLHMTLSLSSPDEGEGRAWPGLHTQQDPSISAIVSRFIELERLQAATVLRERDRTGRSRPATAVPITRCCSRLRKPDPADPRPEFSGRGECRSAVSVFTDVAPSNNAFVTHKTMSVRNKQQRSKMSPKHPAAPSNRPRSCPERRAEKLASRLSPGSSPSPKPTSLNKTKRLKATKKEISKRGRNAFTKGNKSKPWYQCNSVIKYLGAKRCNLNSRVVSKQTCSFKNICQYTRLDPMNNLTRVDCFNHHSLFWSLIYTTVSRHVLTPKRFDVR